MLKSCMGKTGLITIWWTENEYNTGNQTASGGGKFIAFARTLLSKAEVLLFDEVTSTLDLDTSRQMFRVMQDLKKDHTVLVITHNPELMRLSSDIIVVHGGRIVGQGGHATLIRRCKWYKELQA